jgi:ABC-type enterobactin transport system permease subunit
VVLQLELVVVFLSSLNSIRMSLLIFLGIALATALLAMNTFDQLKASLKPVPVRANNNRS